MLFLWVIFWDISWWVATRAQTELTGADFPDFPFTLMHQTHHSTANSGWLPAGWVYVGSGWLAWVLGLTQKKNSFSVFRKASVISIRQKNTYPS